MHAAAATTGVLAGLHVPAGLQVPASTAWLPQNAWVFVMGTAVPGEQLQGRPPRLFCCRLLARWRCLDGCSPAPAFSLPPTALGRYLSRPYGRVDRPKLKRRLLERCLAAGVRFYEAKVRREGSSTAQKGVLGVDAGVGRGVGAAPAAARWL